MAINGDSKLTSYLAVSHLHPVWFFLIASMSSSMGIWDKLNGGEAKWLTMRDAGLFLKTSVHLGKRPSPPVSAGHHIQLKNTHSIHSGFPIGLCYPTLFFSAVPPDWRVCCLPSSITQKKKAPFQAFLLQVEAVSKLRCEPKGDQNTLATCFPTGLE